MHQRQIHGGESVGRLKCQRSLEVLQRAIASPCELQVNAVQHVGRGGTQQLDGKTRVTKGARQVATQAASHRQIEVCGRMKRLAHDGGM